MKKVLIVVSTWMPCMMADMQRARLIAGELPKHGWEVEILAPDPTFQTEFSRLQGEGLEFPDVPVHEVAQWQPEFFRRIGSRNIGVRAAVPVRRAGLSLLRKRNFDLVYFSTTQHWLTCSGARWRCKTGVPYVADLHDPVYLEKKVYFISRHRIKERVAKYLGKTIEKLSLGRADGLVSVSQGYVDDVARRQPQSPWRQRDAILVQPFPADLRALESVAPARPSTGARKRLVYVGAGGNIMEKGWREFVGCLARQSDAGDFPIELHGTDANMRASSRHYLQDIAAGCGARLAVCEKPSRISYEQSIALINGADGLLVLGVDDPNYRPSKLHTYLATGLPVLVILRSESRMRDLLDSAGPGVHTVTFSGDQFESGRNDAAVGGFLREVKEGKRWTADERAFLKPDEAARAHAELFDACIRKRDVRARSA